MGKYGSGLTFGQACNYEKDEIKHALNGEVLDYWGDDERHWRKASKEETDKVILSAYDNLFYHADQFRASACALEKTYADRGECKEDFNAYCMHMAEKSKNSDYIFEPCEFD